MSRENVEVVRRVYEAAATRDTAAVLALYDPDVELDNTPLGVVGWGSGVHRGHDGLRSFFRDWHEAWEIIEYDYDELIDVSDDEVISLVTRQGRGRASGADVELPLALVWTVRGDKVVRVVWYPSREDAMAALEAAEPG
jgi:ketosteroid isomerase-like protein